jgi:hypothetical protein
MPRSVGAPRRAGGGNVTAARTHGGRCRPATSGSMPQSRRRGVQRPRQPPGDDARCGYFWRSGATHRGAEHRHLGKPPHLKGSHRGWGRATCNALTAFMRWAADDRHVQLRRAPSQPGYLVAAPKARPKRKGRGRLSPPQRQLAAPPSSGCEAQPGAIGERRLGGSDIGSPRYYRRSQGRTWCRGRRQVDSRSGRGAPQLGGAAGP